MCGYKNSRFCGFHGWNLSTESVQGTSLPLQSVDNIHGSDGLPLGVLGVGDSITDDVFEEHFQHASCLFVDQPWDSFHSTTACQSSDCRLGYALDVVSKNFSVSLGASLSKTFSSFSSSWHLDLTCLGSINSAWLGAINVWARVLFRPCK